MATGLPHLWDAMVGSLRNNIHINNFGNYASDLSWEGWQAGASMSVLNWTPFLFLPDRKSLLEKGDAPAQELVNSLQVFETTAASMDTQLHPLVINFCMKCFSLFIASGSSLYFSFLDVFLILLKWYFSHSLACLFSKSSVLVLINWRPSLQQLSCAVLKLFFPCIL